MSTPYPSSAAPRQSELSYIDMHCHLELMHSPAQVAREAETLGLGLFATTVTPDAYDTLELELAANTNVRLGVGAHPWWIARGELSATTLTRAVQSVGRTQFVGEVGLDFSRKCATETHAAQEGAFLRMCSAAAAESIPERPTILSIHAVHAAARVLELLEQSGALARCACIYHWFSGSTPELMNARDAGCYFSIGEQSLKTGKGREYVKLIPADKLLLETDFPPQEGWTGGAAEIQASLTRASQHMAEIRNVSHEELREHVLATSRELLQI